MRLTAMTPSSARPCWIWDCRQSVLARDLAAGLNPTDWGTITWRVAQRRGAANEVLAGQPGNGYRFDDPVGDGQTTVDLERDYEELTQELGLGHYEGRGWRGFPHHATLCLAAYGFLIAERSRFSPSARAGRAPGHNPHSIVTLRVPGRWSAGRSASPLLTLLRLPYITQ